MPDILASRAIVLSGKDLGESDRLITFYTQTAGKVKGVAKGAKRSQRRFLNALEPFTLLDLTFVPSRTGGLGRVEAVEIIDAFAQIRGRIALYAMGCLCCELVDLWTREGEAQEKIFELLAWVLNAMAEGPDAEKQTLYFKIHLLGLAGYSPDWDTCLGCRRPPSGRNLALGMPSGGIFCETCRQAGHGSMAVGMGTLCALKFLQRSGYQSVSRLAISPAALHEGWLLLQHLHCHHLQQAPASYKFLSEIG